LSHHDLGVKLDAVIGEVAQLRNDLGRLRVAQHPAAHQRVGGVHRHVERRQPVPDDPVDVVLLEVGQRGEIAVAEGEPVIVVADVEHLPNAVGVPLHETEITAIGAAADPGRLDRHAEGFVDGALDFDLEFVGRLRGPEGKLEVLVSGEKLPIEKILELLAVDREQFGAFNQANGLADRVGGNFGDTDHVVVTRGGRIRAISPYVYCWTRLSACDVKQLRAGRQHVHPRLQFSDTHAQDGQVARQHVDRPGC
jgi:hypothetical protein